MVAPVTGVPLINPVTAQIPDFIKQQMLVSRQQAMADALSQQGQAPIDYDPRGRISWTQGLAKILQSGMGSALGINGINQQASLQQQGMQAMGPMYGFGGQPSPQALGAAIAPSDAAHAAMSAGAQGGSTGPTNQNAALMAQMLQQGQSQPPQQAPASAPPSGPLNPFGAPPMLAWSASQGDPAALEQMKTFGANATLTQEAKNNQYSGISREQMKAMALAKAIKEAQISHTPGEFTSNAFTGQGGFYPSLPPNTQPTGSVGSNGYVGGVAPVPGAPQAMQTNAQAGAMGTTAGSVHTVTNPDGSSSTGLGGDLFHVPPAVQASRNVDQLQILRDERAKPGNSPADNAALDREIARAGGSQVATGPNPTDAAVQKTNADSIAALPKVAEQSKSAITGLESALQTLNGVKATGPGTAKAINWGALLNNFGVPVGKDNVENYQLAQKFLANSLNGAAAGTGASGSDARFASFSGGQPDAEKMDKAPLESAVRYVLSQHDANLARTSFVQNAYQQAKTAGDPNAAQTALQQWSKTYQPQYFSFNRMSAPEQTQFLKSKGPDAKSFVQGYNDYAAQTGWVH